MLQVIIVNTVLRHFGLPESLAEFKRQVGQVLDASSRLPFYIDRRIVL